MLAFLFLFVFTLSFRETPYTLRSLLLDIAKFPLYATTFFSHEVRAVIFFHKSYWDNLRLVSENAALENRVLALSEMAGENERLRKLLGLKTALPYQTAVGLAIGRDFGSFRTYVVLDKGRANGVKKYAPVLSAAGLIGKVLEVGYLSSKVILINDPDLSVPAKNIRTGEQGLVSGTLDGRCKLRFLDLDSDVSVGDLIVTSGLNMTYPEGIALGKVKWVGVETSGLGKFAILEPSARLSSLDEALVVIK